MPTRKNTFTYHGSEYSGLGEVGMRLAYQQHGVASEKNFVVLVTTVADDYLNPSEIQIFALLTTFCSRWLAHLTLGGKTRIRN